MNDLIWPFTLVLVTLIICVTYLIKNRLNKYGSISKVSNLDIVTGTKGKSMAGTINSETVEREKMQNNSGYETYYDIFISYRRLNSKQQVEGRDIARLLVKELKLYGFSVFYDYTHIDNSKQCLPKHKKILTKKLSKHTLKTKLIEWLKG